MAKKKQEAPEKAPEVSTIETGPQPDKPESGPPDEETQALAAPEINSVEQLSAAYPDLVEELILEIREGVETDFKAARLAKEQVEAARIAEEKIEAERIVTVEAMVRLDELSETPFGQLVLRLSDNEIMALETLEAAGWKMFMEAKLEDVKEKGGGRHRTFRNEGRYDLVAALKKAG